MSNYLSEVTFKVFRRASFTVYWQDASPSTEVFYLPKDYNVNTLGWISYVEDTAKHAMSVYYDTDRVLQVIYITSNNVELSDDDELNLSWRVLEVDSQYNN